MLESLGQAVRSVGFMLPGGLGAQESGIVAAGMMVGIGPDLALAVALIKRARELAYGVPGLIARSAVEPARGRSERRAKAGGKLDRNARTCVTPATNSPTASIKL